MLRWLCDSPRTGCAWRTTPYIYVARTSNNRVIMACELAATVRSFAHMPFGISDRNTSIGLTAALDACNFIFKQLKSTKKATKAKITFGCKGQCNDYIASATCAGDVTRKSGMLLRVATRDEGKRAKRLPVIIFEPGPPAGGFEEGLQSASQVDKHVAHQKEPEKNKQQWPNRIKTMGHWIYINNNVAKKSVK